MSATANVVIIAAIITKDGPSNHDVRHQATLGLLPRSLVTAITSCMLMSLSVKPAAIGGHAHVDAYPVAPDGIERFLGTFPSLTAIAGMAYLLLQGRAWPGRKGPHERLTHGAINSPRLG